MQVKFFQLSKDKIKDFATLLFEFFKELREKQGWKIPSKKEIEKESYKILKSNDMVIMAYNNQTPVGFIRVYIEEIFVKKGFRRKGIAQEMVKIAEKKVREQGENFLYLLVLPQDKNAIQFWKNMGYEILNALELVKELDENKNDEELISLEVLGQEFKMFEWKNYPPSEIETEFIWRIL